MVERVRIEALDGTFHEVGQYTDKHEMGKYQGRKWHVPYYNESILDVVASDLKGHIKKGTTCNILITGRVRTGKSTIGQKIARRVDKRLPLESVVFWTDDYLGSIRDHPFASYEDNILPQTIWDESILGLMNRRWYSEVSMNIIETNEVCAKKGILQYIIIPHKNKLDVAVRNEMIHLWIHCFLSKKLHRGYAEVRIPVENIFDDDVFWKPEYAFRFAPFHIDDPFWIAYEKKKDEVINKVLTGEHRTKPDTGRAKEWRVQRDALVIAWFEYAKKFGNRPLKQKDIARIINKDPATVNRILSTKDIVVDTITG